MAINWNTIGKLGKDWELKVDKNNKPYAINSLAVRNNDGSISWLPLYASEDGRIKALRSFSGKGCRIYLAGTLTITKENKIGFVYIEKFEFIDDKRYLENDDKEAEKEYEEHLQNLNNIKAKNDEEVLWN